MDEVPERQSFGGNPARAVRFTFPLDAVKDGNNELHVQQETGLPQQIVWAEICVEPGRRGKRQGISNLRNSFAGPCHGRERFI